jgi:anti-sigma regulatory factor (Ser/Thr protein kinase)
MLTMHEELDLTLPPRPESVAEARHASARLLNGFSDRSRSEAMLIVSELVTNALRHGPEQPVSLRLRRDDDAVQGEVEDEGTAVIRERPEARPASGGFGLHLVDVLSDRWGIEAGSSRVWFELSDRPD